jgi:phosphoglycolate phosphatase
LERLRALGLELAVVANWDVSLSELLEHAGVAPFFRTIVHGARKPAPDGLLSSLASIGVDPARALHIGDSESDERAARVAGMQFAPAPADAVVATLA